MFLFLSWLLLQLLSLHLHQKLQKNLLQLFQRVKNFYSSSSVQSSRLQQPQIAIFRIVSAIIDWLRQNINLFLDLRVLPGHVRLKLIYESMGKDLFLTGVLPRIVPLKEIEKLFDVVIAVLVIEVNDEGDGSDSENFHLFGFAVDLQIVDKAVLGGDFFAKLEVVDYLLFGIAVHLLVAVFILIEDPLEIGHTFSQLYLPPNLTITHYLPHEVLIVIAIHHRESQLLCQFYFTQLFMYIIFPFVNMRPDPMGQTG